MDNRYITSQEAADLIGCTRQHVSHLARIGRLKSKKFGNVLMIGRQSADDYSFSRYRAVGRPLGSLDTRPRQRRQPEPSVITKHKTGRVRRSVG